MLRSHIRLGRIAGIEIGLHYSWFIIAILITWSLVVQFRQTTPWWSTDVIWGAAIITSVLFFVTLLMHELAHSLLAKARGLKVRAITLFALGGVSQIESEAEDAKSEFWIAIVGPLTSVAIGFACIGLSRVAGWSSEGRAVTPVAAVLLWLGYINILLGIFNMIPGYPLDGGRVLRGIIWWITKNQAKSTRTAARVGQVVAILFILYGLYRFFLGENFGGLWLAFIGWFLLDAARGSVFQTELVTELRGRHVSDLMDRDCATVESHISVHDFVEEYLLRRGQRCFVVVQNNAVVGLLTSAEVRKVRREDWPVTSLQSIMRPLSQVRAVSPDTPALQALEMMAKEDINQLPVISDGHLEGIFSRTHVLKFLQLHAELQGHR